MTDQLAIDFTSPTACPHGHTSAGCPHCLARSSDPATSKAAAATIDHRLTARHVAAIALYRDRGPLTDDQAADALVALGVARRHEQARRLVRTIRENHHRLRPHRGPDGEHATSTNPSGRAALLWELDQ